MPTAPGPPSGRRRLADEALVHRDAWIRSGVSDRRLASAEFMSPMPGYHHRSAYAPSLRELGGVIQRDYAPDSVISHATAAEHLGWPLPPRLMHRRTGTLHASSATRELRNRRIVIHRRQGITGVRVGGLAVTSVEETLADIAPLLHHDELVGVMDALLVPHRPWAPARTRTRPLTRAELGRRIDGLRAGRRGVRAVRAAFRDAREGVDSVMETRLRLLVCRLGSEEPAVNPCVVAPDTGERFWVDLAYPERRIAIEYDGKGGSRPGLRTDVVGPGEAGRPARARVARAARGPRGPGGLSTARGADGRRRVPDTCGWGARQSA